MNIAYNCIPNGWSNLHPLKLICADTYKRNPWFSTPDLALNLIGYMEFYAVKFEIRLHALCIMPTHYSLILEHPWDLRITRFPHWVHSYSTKYINESMGNDTNTHIWQNNGRITEIENEDIYWQKVTDILLNPYRAGFSQTALDLYPYSNMRYWQKTVGEEFLIDLFSRYQMKNA